MKGRRARQISGNVNLPLLLPGHGKRRIGEEDFMRR